MKVPQLENLMIVPEHMIIDCASAILESNNNFKDSLMKGNEYRLAGLTPIYLCNKDFNEIYVTSCEKLQKLYN